MGVVMKKIFIVFIVMYLTFCFSSIKAHAGTGHKGFSEITIKGEGKLLVDMTDDEINVGYRAMGKRKFWGWHHHYFLIQEEATYRGEIIFAKSNRTDQPVEINYLLQEKEYTENSWKVTGSISGKIQGKIKGADVSVNGGAEGEKKDTESYTRFEETKFKVLVEPNHRLIFQITGDCLVTSGVSKYYILGITSKKGAWEYVEVVTRYYELYTTEIKE